MKKLRHLNNCTLLSNIFIFICFILGKSGAVVVSGSTEKKTRIWAKF